MSASASGGVIFHGVAAAVPGRARPSGRARRRELGPGGAGPALAPTSATAFGKEAISFLRW